MEHPQSWDLLTSSLAVWDLDTDARRAWAFLVVQDLVRDDSEDRSSFLRIVREEIAQGPITGPSVPKRVASELRTIGVAVRQRERPDPMAQIAQARLDTILQWCKQQPDLAPAHGEHRKKAPVEFLSALSRVIRSRRKS